MFLESHKEEEREEDEPSRNGLGKPVVVVAEVSTSLEQFGIDVRCRFCRIRATMSVRKTNWASYLQKDKPPVLSFV
jgi:hypothetical protein